MQIVSIEVSLHEMPMPVFWEKKNKEKCSKMSSVENFTQSAKRWG